jgi:hypothetical protein
VAEAEDGGRGDDRGDDLYAPPEHPLEEQPPEDDLLADGRSGDGPGHRQEELDAALALEDLRLVEHLHPGAGSDELGKELQRDDGGEVVRHRDAEREDHRPAARPAEPEVRGGCTAAPAHQGPPEAEEEEDLGEPDPGAGADHLQRHPEQEEERQRADQGEPTEALGGHRELGCVGHSRTLPALAGL